MAEVTPNKPKAAAKTAPKTAKPTTKKPATASSGSGNGARVTPMAPADVAGQPAGNTTEAKTRFNAALEEARAGAAALKAEGVERAKAYGEQARGKSESFLTEAKAYGEQARGKAGELAVDGKGRLAEAISAFGRAIFDTAPTVDERLGAKYGDYARSASRTLQETSAKLDAKSVDEISEDAREFVRKSPGLAVGIAAVGGFLIARLFRGSND
jgi:ElaB/YqjD/DUF883 family membrane-anchored ribosome-binding protein